MTEDDRLTAEVTDLLQHLIRNACVNDGTAVSGQEIRNCDLLAAYLGDIGFDLDFYEPAPGRRSLVARIEGTDPDAESLCFMGHTDVVPVTPSGWRRDPFGGELVNGEVWGRGAVDMLNLTASMAVAFRHLATSGFRPHGDLVFFAVADEEAGGHYGAEWLTNHHYDAIAADFVLTESGGVTLPDFTGATGGRVTMTVGEKGICWKRLRVSGTPGHGSMPFAADNAVVKAAEVVRRLAAYRSPALVTDTWRAYVEALDADESTKTGLLDPATVWDTLGAMDEGMAKYLHAATHTTFSPNVVHGGVKTNVIPDIVEIDVDVRTLPGETADDVDRHLARALGDLWTHVSVSTVQDAPASESPTPTRLWDTAERVVRKLTPASGLVPRMTSGGTDARFYRTAGAVAYGFGLFTPKVSAAEFASRFHGNDERVDIESLALTTTMWSAVAREFLG